MHLLIIGLFRHSQLAMKPLPDEAEGNVDVAFQILQRLCLGKLFLIILDDVPFFFCIIDI